LTEHEDAALQIVEIMPHLLSKISADMRCAGVGMNPPHFRVLALLAEEPHNLSELAEYQGVSLATMSKTVATLMERGWVQRIPKTSDRRMVRVELSPLGKQMLVDMHCLLHEKLTELLVPLSTLDVTQLSGGLRVLQKALSAAPAYETLRSFDETRACREETGRIPGECK
jgi:DNA-binding MarR family transcriptional regulator